MADKSHPSQGKRVPYDFLNNVSSVDLFHEEKRNNNNKKIFKEKQFRYLPGRAADSKDQDADVKDTVLH